MPPLTTRTLTYSDGDTEMQGHFCAPEVGAGERVPGVIVMHGAHGLNAQIRTCAERIARQGFAVLCADLWGGGRLISDPTEIGPLLGRFAHNRDMWKSRMAAAQACLAKQAEAKGPTAMIGYCFGGTSALEYLRMGGKIAAAISLHGGLDMVADDWSAARPGGQALIATGSADPMARAEDRQRIEDGMSHAGLIWESMIFGGVKHGFTEPDKPGRPPFAAYDARADTRSFGATINLLNETLRG